MRRGGGRIEGRVRHAQRLEKGVPQIGLVGLAAYIGQHAPQQRVAQVAVFEGEARRAREQVPGGDHRIEFGRRQAQHAVSPRIVGDEARGMREQVAHRHRRAVAGGGLHRRELRNVPVERRIELQLSLVAQRQDGQRRHVLGHRGDAEGGPCLYAPAALPVGKADRPHMGEAALLHDAQGEARDSFPFGEGGAGRIDLGEDCRRVF